jgi:hypothetical protein
MNLAPLKTPKFINFYRICVLSSLAFFFCVRAVFAQSPTASITGRVTDQSKAVITGATVNVINEGTNASFSTSSDQTGSYILFALQPGTYRIEVEKAGFVAIIKPEVVLHVQDVIVFNFEMAIGSTVESITLYGSGSLIDNTSNAVGILVNEREVMELPLTTRNYTNLLGLSAGANAAVYDAAGLGKGTQDIAVNGGSTSQNNYRMDGVSLNSPGTNGSGADTGFNSGIGIVNPDAIQEFKIQTAMFDAGYGRKPGANVNVVTKTGTNEFHGTAFEFFRNTVLNANDFFRNQSPPVSGVPNNTRQVLNQNQYGAVVGGPIKKDKLFFFSSYQQTWQKNGIAAQGFSAPTLPPIPAGDRSNSAVFRTALGSIFCPTAAQGGTCPSTTGGMTSVGGVQILADGSNINPVAINLLQLKNHDGSYLIPSSSNGLYQPTTFSLPAVYSDHQALANTDYVINSKNSLSGKWFLDGYPTQIPFGCSANAPAGSTLSTCLPDTAGNTFYSQQTGMIRLTSILKNTLVNEARMSFSRSTSHLTSTTPFTDTEVGIAPITLAINYLDQIIISQNGFTIGTNFVLGGAYKNSTTEVYADQISWSRGNHTIRAGVEAERDQINAGLPGDSVAALTFQTFQDFLLGLPGCSPQQIAAGCSPATPTPGTNGTSLSNISNSGNFSTLGGPKGPAFVNFLQSASDAFVQDDIKLASKVTANLGLRWDFDAPVTSQSGELGNVWPSLVNTVPIPGSTPATGTLAGFVVPSNYQPAANPVPPVGGLYVSGLRFGTRNSVPLHDFAPRVGLAWQPTSSDRLVVRGGFGYFYERLTEGNAVTTYFIGQPNDILIGRSGSANFASSFAQPLPVTTSGWQDRWVNFANGTSSNLAQYIQQENYLTPLVYEWNLNIQYEFVRTWVLEVGYVGSHGIHLSTSNQEINQAQLVGNPLGNNALTAPGIAAGLVTTNTAANASLRVPYLGFAPGGLISGATDGDDKFNSLQVTVRKQLSHGLTVQAAYTWSKSLATGTLQTNNADIYGQQYGPNPFYHPQRLAINYSWELPSGHAEGLKGRLVNGWAVSGVTIAQDGVPVTVTDSRGGSIYGFEAGSAETSTAQFCAGGAAGNAQASGSVKSRLHSSTVNGINGVGGYFNTAVFNNTCTTPAIGSDGSTGYGNSPIGVTLGPGQFNWDISLSKTTTVGGINENASLQFRSEIFNAFNHAQFANPVTNVAASNFGSITSTSVNPRLIQFALKYIF